MSKFTQSALLLLLFFTCNNYATTNSPSPKKNGHSLTSERLSTIFKLSLLTAGICMILNVTSSEEDSYSITLSTCIAAILA